MNSSFTIHLSLIVIFFFFFNFLSICTRVTDAAPTYLLHSCPNTTLFTPNSTYQTNLNTLLSSLSSAAAAVDADGFANATAGKNPLERTYGLFLCRGDIAPATCGDCIANASKEILRNCPKEKDSIIWYDECMLRYSNRSIFSIEQESPGFIFMNTDNISNPSSFSRLLKDTTNELAERAASDGSGKKFAVKDTNITSSDQLYTLAQCTPDLTAADCKACLRKAINYLPSDRAGGRVLAPSCNVRFELYKFYNETVFHEAPAPAPTLAPPPPAVVAASPSPYHKLICRSSKSPKLEPPWSPPGSGKLRSCAWIPRPHGHGPYGFLGHLVSAPKLNNGPNNSIWLFRWTGCNSG
ncbi:putative cysteine-rich receptor-like protein kinase 9 [Rhodamnia argentea]|uniref:Cysteine-rich receptor-like protein kinase 9 n=1 Tax=Rhodamnia argentea TaxID=178133 RepID=A0A8B8N6J9_9MYRT|nr:putative cysteine-rich receptor-like protein kinase 9 [Rhodamnia argentea]